MPSQSSRTAPIWVDGGSESASLGRVRDRNRSGGVPHLLSTPSGGRGERAGVAKRFPQAQYPRIRDACPVVVGVAQPVYLKRCFDCAPAKRRQVGGKGFASPAPDIPRWRWLSLSPSVTHAHAVVEKHEAPGHREARRYRPRLPILPSAESGSPAGSHAPDTSRAHQPVQGVRRGTLRQRFCRTTAAWLASAHHRGRERIRHRARMPARHQVGQLTKTPSERGLCPERRYEPSPAERPGDIRCPSALLSCSRGGKHLRRANCTRMKEG